MFWCHVSLLERCSSLFLGIFNFQQAETSGPISAQNSDQVQLHPPVIVWNPDEKRDIHGYSPFQVKQDLFYQQYLPKINDEHQPKNSWKTSPPFFCRRGRSLGLKGLSSSHPFTKFHRNSTSLALDGMVSIPPFPWSFLCLSSNWRHVLMIWLKALASKTNSFSFKSSDFWRDAGLKSQRFGPVFLWSNRKTGHSRSLTASLPLYRLPTRKG